MEPLEGIAEADAHLGRPVPLPHAPLPLTRWVDLYAVGPGAVEIAWNLDDTRSDAPGRVALYAGTVEPPARALDGASPPAPLGDGFLHTEAPLDAAQPSLRPVHELRWRLDDLHLRLTAQGPWAIATLVAIAQSIG